MINISPIPIEDFEFKHERYLGDKPCNSITDLIEIFKQEIGNKNYESVFALYCDNEHVPIKATLVGVGNSNKVLFAPKRIIQGAMLYGAQYVYTVHNHPSQEIKPSEEDHNFTKQLTAMCKLCDITYAGSIIVTRNRFYSLSGDISDRKTKSEYRALF